MTHERPRDVAYDDDVWVDPLMAGSAHYVSSDRPRELPALLVPDGHGDYREHRIGPRPKGRLGF